MKQKGFFFANLCCLFFVFACLASCKKEAECTGIIYTYIENEAGVRTPLGGCTLIIGEEDFAPDVKRTVVTAASGRYEGTWLRQAYLPIIATKDTYRGVAYLKLESGNVTMLEIPLY